MLQKDIVEERGNPTTKRGERVLSKTKKRGPIREDAESLGAF